MAKDITKEYSNGELTVVWKPGLCIHSGVCVDMLPDVYKPNEKPWIKVKNASTEVLKKQIKKCPSGALSYYMNDSAKKEAIEKDSEPIVVEAMKDGPLMVHGKIKLIYPDGRKGEKSKVTAFCRCGHSTNKPFCDGTHKKAGFEG